MNPLPNKVTLANSFFILRTSSKHHYWCLDTELFMCQLILSNKNSEVIIFAVRWDFAIDISINSKMMVFL